MAKSVAFASNPRSKPSPDDLDAFVHGGGGPNDPAPSAARPAPAAAEPAAPVPEPPPLVAEPAPLRSAKVPMKRLTFDIPAELHRRIRIDCVGRGIDMAEDLRRILAEHYPPKS